MQALFEEAIAMARLPDGDASSAAPAGFHWYPYGYMLGFLCRRAEYGLTVIGAISYPLL